MNDLRAIRRLLESVPGVWQPDWRDDALQRALAAAGDLAFVAESDAELVGFCCGHDMGFRAYLSELAVSPLHQRKGIGQALLAALESELQKRGCAVLVADIFPPAEPFYRKLAWVDPQSKLLARRLSMASGSPTRQ